MSLLQGITLFLSAFGAGILNAVAGGGTLLSFPALLSIGLDPKIANATSTMALWPGLAGSLFGYRREILQARSYIKTLAAISLVGGVVGTLLLIQTPSALFAQLVPLLILFATLLFSLQEPIVRWLRTWTHADQSKPRQWSIFAFFIQFLAAVYGAYFGAGNGILILSALGLLGIHDIHVANGLKIILAICLNVVAITGFAVAGLIAWGPAGLMAIGALSGGYCGAAVARRLSRKLVRGLVILIGLAMGLWMLVKMY
jgi:uncharacterized membrane protein YfcA